MCHRLWTRSSGMITIAVESEVYQLLNLGKHRHKGSTKTSSFLSPRIRPHGRYPF